MEVQIYSHDKNGLVPSGYILADRFKAISQKSH